MSSWRILAAASAALALFVAGCSGSTSSALHQSINPLQPPVTTVPPSTTLPAPTCRDLAPNAAPDTTVAPGSFMAKIQDRGRLIVGVDQNTKYFGYRDPRTGKLDGLDIDMLRAVARALFGLPAGADVDNRLDFRAVTTGERIPAVQRGDVDIVASLVTVLPERQQQVCLSSVYYLAHQGVLVRDDGQISSPQDLAGKRVCATKGSDSITQFHDLVPKAIMAPATFRTDCLVALEEGTVDAITADDTILLGFEAQDPKTAILPQALSNEPYAIAVSADHPEFVRFVNAVLQHMRDDGSLAALYTKWLGSAAPPVPDPQYQG